MVLIALKSKAVKTTDSPLDVAGQLAGPPSCTGDAIALVLTQSAALALCKEAAAVQFVMDAFGRFNSPAIDQTTASA